MSDSEELRSKLEELPAPDRELFRFALSVGCNDRLPLARRVGLWQSSFKDATDTIEALLKVHIIRMRDRQDDSKPPINDSELDQKDYMRICDNLAQNFCIQLCRFEMSGNAIENIVRANTASASKQARAALKEYVKLSLEEDGVSADRFEGFLETIRVMRDQLIAHDDAIPLMGDEEAVPEEVRGASVITQMGFGGFSHRSRSPAFDLEDWKELHKISKSFGASAGLLNLYLQDLPSQS